MICKWCKGNGRHTGKEGHKDACEHCCGFGKTAHRPGGKLRNVLHKREVKVFSDIYLNAIERRDRDKFDNWFKEYVQSIAIAKIKLRLDDKTLNKLVKYWFNPRRDETFGEFIQRVAQVSYDYLEKIDK